MILQDIGICNNIIGLFVKHFICPFEFFKKVIFNSPPLHNQTLKKNSNNFKFCCFNYFNIVFHNFIKKKQKFFVLAQVICESISFALLILNSNSEKILKGYM